MSYAGFCGFAGVVLRHPRPVLSWYAALLYVPLARRALREGRAAGADAGVGSTA